MSGLDSILKEQTNFYKSLFTSEGCDQHAADILLSNINVRLSDDESENLDKMMNIKNKAIKLLKCNKSPGEDGLTVEFYLKFWDLICIDFADVVTELF